MYWYNREGTSKCVLNREPFSSVPLSEVLEYQMAAIALEP